MTITLNSGSLTQDNGSLTQSAISGLTRTDIAGELLIVSFGESNSGGFANNADALAAELGPRPELNMWNVTTQVFEPLHIGVNNNLDHSGLASTSHGWELQLANKVRLGLFDDYAGGVYYLQTGQGGSTVAQWAVGNGSGFWTKFLNRTNAVKARLPDATTVVWMTLGINDAIAGTTEAAYESGMLSIIANVKAQLPGVKIFLTDLPPVNATYIAYSAIVVDIAADDPDIYLIAFNNMQMRDANHPGYGGMKTFGMRFIKSMRDNGYLLGTTANSWAIDSGFVADGDGVRPLDGSTGNSRARLSSNPITKVTGLRYIMDFALQGDATVLMLKDSAAINAWSGVAQTYYAGIFWNAGVFYCTQGNFTQQGSPTAGSTQKSCLGSMRISGDNIIIEYSVDLGVSWTTLHTFTGALTGITQYYLGVIAVLASPTGYTDSWVAS